ncbi:MAG: substrate-binding domain-containing protein [Myxococcales bacterium]|nr:substrate-binding domain-containing protein [Myxococcales bacterium]MDH5305998.1 substrate-binding domain-containing protein [Myxococcales bacterium]MDH5566377.1 substrate-binding domain-containing protein [Myxococcales bacterium]
MRARPLLGAIAGIALGLSGPLAAAARDQIRIVGSSTVYPFATVVAEELGRATSFKTPIIESTGTGGGLKLFCAGAGVDTPDITNASRRIKKSELDLCASHGVSAITEIKIGYDGIVLANSKKSPQMQLTLRQLFLALAKQVPAPNGDLIQNPHKTWKDVDASLPALPIEVLGPPPTSGTRDAFNELALEGGCNTFPDLKALAARDKSRYQAVCQSVREDGAYVEAGENDNLIVQKLVANPNAVGVFGFSFLDQNADVIQGASVGGVAPSFDAIAGGAYPVSRALYFYVKNAHVGSIPGMREYLAEFTSEQAIGDYGYLAERGLIPAPEAEREQARADAQHLAPLVLAVEP